MFRIIQIEPMHTIQVQNLNKSLFSGGYCSELSKAEALAYFMSTSNHVVSAFFRDIKEELDHRVEMDAVLIKGTGGHKNAIYLIKEDGDFKLVMRK